jgi:hypothetical protein
MRFLKWSVSVSSLWLASAFISGCSESKTELGVSPEFRKADLASQEAMRSFMETQNKSKPKVRGKAKPRVQ